MTAATQPTSAATLPQPRANITELKPYIPGRPIAEVMRAYNLAEVVKLASNENPFGPPPGVQDAVAATLDELWLYPDNDAADLTAKLADFHGLETNQLVLTAGSSHALELIARAYAGPGDDVVFSAHGFICYRLFTKAVGATAVVVPEIDLTADVSGLLAAITPRTKILFLANPNNPTGTLLDEASLRRLLDGVPSHVLVVLDEAYAEYAQSEGAVDGMTLLAHYPNLVVTRTFSKAYGLAAVRFGYGAGHPAVIDMLRRVRPPFSVSTPAVAAATAALAGQSHIQHAVAHNLAEKKRLSQAYTELGVLACPSYGNFLLLDIAPTGQTPAALFEAFQRRGVIVRPVAEYGLTTHLRVSIGLRQENDSALALFRETLR